MAEYLGRRWSRRELLSRLGDPSQLAAATPTVLADGKGEGVRAVHVSTGGGLDFWVLPGRGMDIAGAHFRGRAVGFLSGTGITSPAYYEEPGLSWLRSFYGGLLTTCGLANAGAPSTDQGQAFGLHGRLANAAAENFSIDQEWEGEEYRIRLKGRMREVAAMGENLTLTRTVETELGRAGLSLRDVVENRGFRAEPLMLLYHFNFGFPLLGPAARVVGPITATEPRDQEAHKDRGVEECLRVPEPQPGYREKVFFHTLAADGEGRTFIALLNPDVGDGSALGVVLRFSRRELPELTHWKMPAEGFYVTGLEPGTVSALGRGPLRQAGKLPMVAPQERRSVSIDIEVVERPERLRALEEEARALVEAAPG